MPVKSTTTLFEEKNKDTKRINAIDVFRWSAMSKTIRQIRSVDLDSKEITATHSTQCFKGNERLIHLETNTGYVVECTPNTEIWDGKQWVKADLLDVGTEIWVNGEPCERYKEKEWLEEWYVKRHKTQQEIADMCSTPDYPVSARTIRFWVKRFELGRGDGGKTFGENNPNYKGLDNISKHGLYARMKENIKKKDYCEICGRTQVPLDIHHLDHDLMNIDESNFITLCEKCHMAEHRGNIVAHTRPAKITVKRLAGCDDCIGIMTESGNYVAEGFVIKSDDV